MTSFIASDPDLLEIGSFSIYSHSTHSSVVVHILLLKYMHLECKGSPRGGGGGGWKFFYFLTLDTIMSLSFPG